MHGYLTRCYIQEMWEKGLGNTANLLGYMSRHASIFGES